MSCGKGSRWGLPWAERRGGPAGPVPYWTWGALVLCLTGCAPVLPPRALLELDDVRQAPAARQAATWAPRDYEQAEQLRGQARQAFEEGELGTAQILAEQARAAYARAVALSRLAQAERSTAEAELEVEQAEQELGDLDSQRQQARAAIESLETRLAVLRDAEPLVPSAAAGPARERARARAVETIRLEARLLCTAAGLLLGPDEAPQMPPHTSDASRAWQEAQAQQRALDELCESKPAAAPIDQAMRVRASCLAALTAARRRLATDAEQSGGSADALLERLSSVGVGTVLRDERGVAVTLRQPFDDARLSASARRDLAALREVVVELSSLPVLIVVHEAVRGGPEQQVRAQQRARAVAQALGRPEAAVALAGAARPVVDPDGRYAARNERVEIVFVTRRLL